MDPSEVLKQAWRAVEEADLPNHIQPIAFREAMRVLAPASAPLRARTAADRVGTTEFSNGGGGNARKSPESEEAATGAGEEEIVNNVVQHTGVDRDKLESLVHLDGNAIRLSIPGMKLGKNNAEKTRTVAQILTIVRGFGLNEKETPLEAIRDEATRLKCYDAANFSSTLTKLNGFVITGTGANRRIRAKPTGIEAFASLVDRLTAAA